MQKRIENSLPLRSPDRDIETKLFAAEISTSCPEENLHGKRVHEVETIVNRFLDSHQSDDTDYVRIVCGTGTGAVADKTREVLDQAKHDGLISEWALSDHGTVFLVVY